MCWKCKKLTLSKPQVPLQTLSRALPSPGLHVPLPTTYIAYTTTYTAAYIAYCNCIYCQLLNLVFHRNCLNIIATCLFIILMLMPVTKSRCHWSSWLTPWGGKHSPERWPTWWLLWAGRRWSSTPPTLLACSPWWGWRWERFRESLQRNLRFGQC